jgi:hypothetical protein
MAAWIPDRIIALINLPPYNGLPVADHQSLPLVSFAVLDP